MRERLKKAPSDVMLKYVFGPRIESDKVRSFSNMMRVNEAHTLMLHRQEIIDSQVALRLLSALVNLTQAGPEALDIRPELEDLHYNIEQHLIDVVGREVGGRLHTGRSRNDLYATVLRMNVRDVMIGIYEEFLALRAELLRLARCHLSTVMTGYTHMQPAQPTTLAHYLIGVSEALERDYQRLHNAYGRLNLGPLGSGAFAGTSFDIDRTYTAKVLGFDGLIENTLDGVASRDYFLELAYGFTSLGSTLSRFAYDLHLWCTDEFSYIELDDSMSGTSSIMPQKKNPTPIEHVKAKAGHLLGAFVSIFSCLKNIPFGHSKDSGGEAHHLFWDAASEMRSMLVLLLETVRTLSIDTDKMESRVNLNFCTATDLADELVRREGIPFRTAHQIVGNLVAECHAARLPMNAVNQRMLDEKAVVYLGRPLGWSSEDIRIALDAKDAIDRRRCIGGPSKDESMRLISVLERCLSQDQETHTSRLQRLTGASSLLERDIESVTSMGV